MPYGCMVFMCHFTCWFVDLSAMYDWVTTHADTHVERRGTGYIEMGLCGIERNMRTRNTQMRRRAISNGAHMGWGTGG